MLLFSDSFDHYTDPTEKYSNVYYATIQNTVKRNGTSALLIYNGQSVSKSLGVNRTTLIVGFALLFSGGSGTSFQIYFNDTGNQGVFQIAADGTLSAYRGNFAALLGTASKAVPLGSWHYLEFMFTVDSSVGVAIARLDGIPILSLSNQNTKGSGNYITTFSLMTAAGASYLHYVDDLYVCDTLGSYNASFLGDIVVSAQMPNGNGTQNNFSIGGTSPAATNWQSVDEIPPDEDVTYVFDGNIGDQDRYLFSHVTQTSGIVYGVMAWPRVKKDDAGNRTMRVVTKSGSVVADNGTDIAIPMASYSYEGTVFEFDPNTAQQWTIAGANAAEFGVKITN